MRGERGDQDRTQQHGKKWRPAVTEIVDILEGNRECILLSLNYLLNGTNINILHCYM